MQALFLPGAKFLISKGFSRGNEGQNKAGTSPCEARGLVGRAPPRTMSFPHGRNDEYPVNPVHPV
jgi:hypothetical protein